MPSGKAAQDLNLAGEFGARVRLTGPVPIANEEFATVADGAIVNGIGTVLVVLLILWMALHSAKIISAVFLNALHRPFGSPPPPGLMDGGLAEPALDRIRGSVRRIGRGFRHPVRRPLPLGAFQDRRSAAGAAAGGANARAVPLSLAAMATAAGFLSFLPTDYKGISELGKIAGVGMLVAFLTSITVLPALDEPWPPPGSGGRSRRPAATRCAAAGCSAPRTWSATRRGRVAVDAAGA